MLCVVRLMFHVGDHMSDRGRRTSMRRPNFAFIVRSYVRGGGFRILLQLPERHNHNPIWSTLNDMSVVREL